MYFSVLIALFGFTIVTVRGVTSLLDLNMSVTGQFFEIHFTVFSVFFEYFPSDYGVGTVCSSRKRPYLSGVLVSCS